MSEIDKQQKKGVGKTMLDMEKALEMINSGKSLRVTAKELLGNEKKESTIRKRLNKGYVKEDGKWKLSAHPETQKPNKEEKNNVNKKENKNVNKQEKNIVDNPENNNIIIKENNPSNKQERNMVVKKVTYEIDENIHFELRMQAFKQKKNVSELVEKALRDFLAKN